MPKLRNIFTNTDLKRQDRTFNPYMACIQISVNQGDENEDRNPDQQNMGIGVDKNVSEIRMRSGHISHKPERIGIKTITFDMSPEQVVVS